MISGGEGEVKKRLFEIVFKCQRPLFSLHPVGDAKSLWHVFFCERLFWEVKTRSAPLIVSTELSLHSAMDICIIIVHCWLSYSREVFLLLFLPDKRLASHIVCMLIYGNETQRQSKRGRGRDLISDVETNLIQLSIDHRPHFCYFGRNQNKSLERANNAFISWPHITVNKAQVELFRFACNYVSFFLTVYLVYLPKE